LVEPRAQRSFSEVLPELLREVGKSRRAVLIEAGIDPSLFSKALRGADGKRINEDMIRRLSAPLGVDPEFFAEIREAAVVARVRADPELRDRVFDEVGRMRSKSVKRRQRRA
jgi:transcriptional regulator with XRE-family HTH domain